MKHGPLYLRTAAKPSATRVTPKGLPTHVKVKLGGERKTVPVAYFDKPAISAGKYVHSVTGQRFKVTPERIDRWVEKFRKMKRAGVEVPTPVDHSDAAEDNRGFVVDARREGNTLVLTHQAIGKDAAKLALRNRCSVLIDPDFRDGNGHRWGDVIAHSAYTPKPVVHGHGSFQPIAASRAGGVRRVPVFVKQKISLSQEEHAMPRTADVKAALTALTLKQKGQLCRLLKLKKGTKIKADELLGIMIKAGPQRSAKALAILNATKVRKPSKDRRAQADDTDDDDEDEESESDDDDDDDEEDDVDAEDELDDDEEDESDDDEEDLDDDSEDDEEEEATGRRREKVAASRTVKPDRHTVLLMSRALRTERENAIRKGGITPDVAEALDRILTHKGKPNTLALSAVPGARDPLAFMLYRALSRNKPVPMHGGKSGSQARLALSGGGHGSKKDREAARELKRDKKETADWCKRHGGNRSAKTA
jgi:hypothetical protein